MILFFRNGTLGMLPGALCALLLSSFFLSASVIIRLRADALYIGLGKCLCLYNISKDIEIRSFQQVLSQRIWKLIRILPYENKPNGSTFVLNQ